MVLLAWIVPAHLRAVDVRVLREAGVGSPSLNDHGLQLLRENKASSAQFMLHAAQSAATPANSLAVSLQNFTPAHFQSVPALLSSIQVNSAGSVAETIIQTDNRKRTLQTLARSRSPATIELLDTRSLTNTTLIPESSSSSGQPFDAAVIITALLLEEHRLTGTLSNGVYRLAATANAGANSQRYEQFLLDILSLSQRFTWDQLTVFMANIQDEEGVRHLARIVRNAEGNLHVVFASVRMSGAPGLVANYLMTQRETGMADLRQGMRYRSAGLREMLQRNLRVYEGRGTWNPGWFDAMAWRSPRSALLFKWLLFFLSGYFLAAAVHYMLPVQAPAPVRGFHVAREMLFALGFLVVVLLLAEPYLSQEAVKTDFTFKLRVPTVGAAAQANSNSAVQNSSIMNKLSLLTLLLFFVLQSLLYVACLVKLAEIRRQRIAAPLKLRLLDNEDHLFDAGLYLGFVGTIISLILVSLGVIKPSLMAAYSSTSFGIIFVSVFKIFNLRPLRRKLLLDADLSLRNPGTHTSPSTSAA